ncbi:MAG: hypothetical protein KAU20_02820, partial [Nanoarchaeota archaeon]|nr:hypothetical protein [Nanoarchaeota archaeon]
MNKKAMMLLYPLLAAILIALSTFYFLSIQKSSEITVNYIGESSLDLLKASKKAENALFYIDQSAKFAVGQSINDLAQNGGYYKQSNCGQYIGYYFWQKEDKECYPAELNKNFKLILNENIDKYLEAYPEDIDLEIPEDNYEFTIYDNKLIGTAFSNIIVFIRNEQGTAIGKYSVKPSFSLGF